MRYDTVTKAAMAAVFALSAWVPAAATAQVLDRAALPLTVESLPEGVKQISPVIPGMGSHWANPKDLPVGPIYCVHDGKIVCLEYLLSQEDFKAGKSWKHLANVGGLPPIDHIDIDFLPEGNPAYKVPHYTLHIYFVNKDARAHIK